MAAAERQAAAGAGRWRLVAAFVEVGAVVALGGGRTSCWMRLQGCVAGRGVDVGEVADCLAVVAGLCSLVAPGCGCSGGVR